MIWFNFAFWTWLLMLCMRRADAMGMGLCLMGFLVMQFMIEERDGES